MRLCAVFLPILYLTIFAGCSTVPQTIVETRVQLELPPASLVTPCPVPYKAVTSIGDVIEQLQVTRGALDRCAARVDAIRAWRASRALPSPQ